MSAAELVRAARRMKGLINADVERVRVQCSQAAQPGAVQLMEALAEMISEEGLWCWEEHLRRRDLRWAAVGASNIRAP